MGDLIVFDEFLQSKVITSSNLNIAMGESTIHFSASTILLLDAPSATAADLSLVYSGIGPNMQTKYLRSNTNIGSGNGVYITNISNGLQCTCNNPDQVVTIIGGLGILVTGSYPSYTAQLDTNSSLVPSYFIGSTVATTFTVTPSATMSVLLVPPTLSMIKTADWTSLGVTLRYLGKPRAFDMQIRVRATNNSATSTISNNFSSLPIFTTLSFGNITTVAGAATNQFYTTIVTKIFETGNDVLFRIKTLTNTNVMTNFQYEFRFFGL